MPSQIDPTSPLDGAPVKAPLRASLHPLTEHLSSLILSIVWVPGCARAATVSRRQGATGGRALAWRGSSKWPGTAPAVAAHSNEIEIRAILPRDGRTTWSGFPGEQGFS